MVEQTETLFDTVSNVLSEFGPREAAIDKVALAGAFQMLLK